MCKKDISKRLKMRTKAHIIIIGCLLTFLYSCENREVNQDEGPNFSEIHEEIEYHFDEVDINGLQYLILERDRNNPHEGFGFMALKGEQIRSNQDSIKAYLKTMLDLQNQILSKLNNRSIEEVNQNTQELFIQYLPEERKPAEENVTSTN